MCAWCVPVSVCVCPFALTKHLGANLCVFVHISFGKPSSFTVFLNQMGSINGVLPTIGGFFVNSHELNLDNRYYHGYGPD